MNPDAARLLRYPVSRERARHWDQILVSLPQALRTLQHYGQIQQEFLLAASGQQSDPRLGGVDTVSPGKFLPRNLRQRQIRQRMSNVLGYDSALSVVILFEREDHQH